MLEAARTLFVERGYDGVSVVEIAHEAGISKATVYSYHRSKAGLFRAVVLDAIQLTSEAIKPLPLGDPPAAALRRYLARYAELSCRSGSIELQRTIIGAHDRFPEMGPTIVREVIDRAVSLLADYLAHRGVPEPRREAAALLEAATGPRHTRTLLGEIEPLPDADRPAHDLGDADIDAAVTRFLPQHGIQGDAVGCALAAHPGSSRWSVTG